MDVVSFDQVIGSKLYYETHKNPHNWLWVEFNNVYQPIFKIKKDEVNSSNK